MSYEAIIKYNDNQVKIKVNNKALEQEFELPQFLKIVREIHNNNIEAVHLKTDWTVKDCKEFEEGKKLIPKAYLQCFTSIYKLPAKIQQLGIIQEEETKKFLAARLKELRQRRELSQIIVAAELGIARSTYACYESGRNEPDIHTIIKFADYYNVSIDYLVGRSDKEQ